MKCEKCGRTVGVELLTCSDREQGDCPYQVTTTRKSLLGPGCGLTTGVLIIFFAYWMLTVPDVPTVVNIVLGIGMVLGIGLVLGSAVAGLRREVVISHVDGEHAWRQVTILGRPISEALTTGFQDVPWAEGHIRKLRFPASVVELARSGEAIPIVSTALTHLLNSGVIKIGVVPTKGNLGRSKEQFFLSPGPPAEVSEIPGALEQRMIEVVQLCAQGGREVEYRGNTYQIPDSGRLRLKDFLLMVFEGEKRFPRSWLMEEMVGKQAIELGFGEFGKLGHEKNFKFFDNTKSRLDSDKQSIDFMFKDLWKNQPHFGPELHSQIDYIMVTTIKDKSFFI